MKKINLEIDLLEGELLTKRMGKPIPRTDAQSMIDDYHSNTTNGEKINYFVIKADFLKEVTTGNCAMVKLYFAKNKEFNATTLVIVGADAKGRNIFMQKDLKGTLAEHVYEDLGTCPNECHGGNSHQL